MHGHRIMHCDGKHFSAVGNFTVGTCTQCKFRLNEQKIIQYHLFSDAFCVSNENFQTFLLALKHVHVS